MTNSESDSSSASEARPGKRERLVSAASDLLYRQGVENTPLADMAHAAEVPLGDVFYYCTTKDEIMGLSARSSRNARAGPTTSPSDFWRSRSSGRSGSSEQWVDATRTSWRSNSWRHTKGPRY
jgi:hypothetical protein